MEIYQKLGFKSDIEYFKRCYAGAAGEVIKKTVPLLGDTHPFYFIRRPLEPVHGHECYEFKVYDFYHDGFIEKEIIVEDPNPDHLVVIPTLKEWITKQLKKTTHFRDYVLYCSQAHRY